MASPEDLPEPKLDYTPWYAIGRRFVVALFATGILLGATVTVKADRSNDQISLSLESHEPNPIWGALSIYLLGVATDFNLALPLTLLFKNKGNQDA